MIKRQHKISTGILSSIVFILFFSSCVKFEDVSDIPSIEYKNITVSDAYDSSLGNKLKVVQLSFDFIDGDADLGVYEEIANNTEYPDSMRYGLFVTLYEKVDSIFTEKVLTEWNDSLGYYDTLSLNQYIFYDEKLDRSGQNKTVKGNIECNISVYEYTVFNDSLRLEFYIRDRALNKSNTETSDSFILNETSD